MAPAIVEPYNAILSTHTSLESVDVCFLVDNQVNTYKWLKPGKFNSSKIGMNF